MDQPKRRKNDNTHAPAPVRRFGAIAVRMGFVSLDRVATAIVEQIEDDVHDREHRLMGAILAEQGWITEEQIEQVLREQRSAAT